MTHGRARLVAVALLGAVGIAGMLVQPDLGSENPDYGTRVAFGRVGWLVACCLAAAVLRSDGRSFLAAWLGTLIALPPVAFALASHSPTTAGSPFWIGTGVLAGAVFSLVMLGIAFGATRAVRGVVSPRVAGRLLVGVVGVVLLVSIGMVAIPPGPYTGPQPAPTFAD